MVEATVNIQCDGEIDGDLCPAEFTVSDLAPYVSPLHIALQLQQRGWVIQRPATRVGHLTLCPLHAVPPNNKGELS